jgi:hypothetical protein
VTEVLTVDLDIEMNKIMASEWMEMVNTCGDPSRTMSFTTRLFTARSEFLLAGQQ